MLAGTLKIKLLIIYSPVISRGRRLTARYPHTWVTLSVRRAERHTQLVVAISRSHHTVFATSWLGCRNRNKEVNFDLPPFFLFLFFLGGEWGGHRNHKAYQGRGGGGEKEIIIIALAKLSPLE